MSNHVGTQWKISSSLLPTEFIPILCHCYERTWHITGRIAMQSSGDKIKYINTTLNEAMKAIDLLLEIAPLVT